MSLAGFADFVGYNVVSDAIDSSGKVILSLERKASIPFLCNVCGGRLSDRKRGQHLIHVKHLPVFDKPCVVKVWWQKKHCHHCQKARSEKIPFLCEHTPHLTRAYSYWLSRLCEITSVKEAAEFCGVDDSTLWRVDHKQLKDRFNRYKIPEVVRISVDEVSCRKASKHARESKNDRFFTVITDLDRRKIIWISDTRNKEALDGFFLKIGRARCQKIKVVVTDQHSGYARSIQQFIPRARHILDKFHLLRHFEKAVDDSRKYILKLTPRSKLKKLASGKYRFLFLKSNAKRTFAERQHIEEAMAENQLFYQLELIKERFLTMFYRGNSPTDAKRILLELRGWIVEAGFPPLKRWVSSFIAIWSKVVNYFSDRYTTAISEGFNNVIKTLKRRA